MALLHLASRHEFIVSFFGYHVAPGAVYLSMQRMDQSAQTWLDAQEQLGSLVKRHKDLPEEALREALRQHCLAR